MKQVIMILALSPMFAHAAPASLTADYLVRAYHVKPAAASVLGAKLDRACDLYNRSFERNDRATAQAERAFASAADLAHVDLQMDEICE